MKNIVILGIIVSMMSCAYAGVSYKTKETTVPQGTFKKLRSGKYVHYDSNGKKAGIYKISGGKLVRVK